MSREITNKRVDPEKLYNELKKRRNEKLDENTIMRLCGSYSMNELYKFLLEINEILSNNDKTIDDDIKTMLSDEYGIEYIDNNNLYGKQDRVVGVIDKSNNVWIIEYDVSYYDTSALVCIHGNKKGYRFNTPTYRDVVSLMLCIKDSW